jgi:tRNA dimethylallyltransferase
MISDARVIIAIVGPTAIGKTSISLQIADDFLGEIVGVDSMQVYRYMDIGTAKPTLQERAKTPHHLIDIADPDEEYTVGRYVKDAETAIRAIWRKGNIPLLVGGTGLYLRGLLNGLSELPAIPPVVRRNLQKELENNVDSRRRLYEMLQQFDPESAARIHPHDTQRLLRALEIYRATGIPWTDHLSRKNPNLTFSKVLRIGLTCDRDMLYDRINKRVHQMIRQGLVEEVEGLLARGYHGDLKSMQSIGYRHVVKFLRGLWTKQRTLELLARDTRHYAKRQYTWFRNDPEVQWFDLSHQDALYRTVEKFLTQDPR